MVKMENIECNVKDLQNTVKQYNACTIGVPERKDRISQVNIK